MPRDMVQVRRGRVHQFEQGPDVRVGRSQFNRSHGHKTTFDADYLVPIMWDYVFPGDTFTMSVDGFCRIFSPLEAPIMDNIELEILWFYTPIRLLWSNWEAFNGEHDAAGAQDLSYTIPAIATGWTVPATGSHIGQYLGLPVGLSTTTHDDVSVLPLRAYNRVYSEWFRDQNLIDEPTLNVGNGPDSIGDYTLLKSAKKHDYFTSALPYLQKGTAVTIPLQGNAPVHAPLASTDLGVYVDSLAADYKLNASGTFLQASNVTTSSYELYADLDTSTGGIDINELRESVAIQRLLEREARSGTRYVERIKSMFGVTVPDYRVQRPEYLGGGKAYINVSAVANTSSTATEDQGELRGVGTGRIHGCGFAKSFVEHGVLLGLIRARGDVSYFQGLERRWSWSTKYDWYVPDLANLGEQAILNKELYVQNATADDDVFGYQERWAEMRWKKSLITGKFNPDATGALSQWHLAEDFASAPSLNQTFVESNTPMSRVQTVTSEPDFEVDMWFNYRCARPMPVYSIPSLVTARF